MTSPFENAMDKAVEIFDGELSGLADAALAMWSRSEDMSCYTGPNNAGNPWVQQMAPDMGRGRTLLDDGSARYIVGYWDQWDGTKYDPIRP